jgi:hypothetical protein
MVSLDNMTTRPLLRLDDALCHRLGQWIGGYVDRCRTLQAGGTDVKLIQLLLGQNDIETAMRYARLRSRCLEKIGSRFDWLNL